ncbi:MAG: alpha/beta fold hydrolase [Roseiarcus sp.]
MMTRALKCLGPSGFYSLGYREWAGPAGAPTLVCVHGLTRNSRDFVAFAEAISAHYRVIAPDMPGRGLSDRLVNAGDYAFPVYLQAIAALIARLDVESVDWVGTSMGGLIGMMLAATPGQPIRRLVLNDVGPVIPKSFQEKLATYVGVTMRFASAEALEQVARASYGPQADLSAAQWRYIALAGARQDADGGFIADYDPRIGDVYRATELQDVLLWPIYDRIACPTLILRGALSDILSRDTAETMTERGPRARLVEFAGCAHPAWLVNEAQIEFVRAFLLG